ncbi:serine/threonine-protein kinase [Streptomyces fulvoviolaceus]|uniref:serine/threonine-protein kinase n=1 Tax=Streptomyces fulvoviolaceus TaxID=285535 RepID=UPI0004C6E7B3|nr:serine/threonine-protein kinase [Streptomyces fulvoviolaceus]
MDNATEVFQPLQADDPPVVAGYRLAARLGAGGMGRVYLSHTQGGRPVAIKVVRPELADDPDFRRRFSREIKAARRVRGAYTAELIDADADGVPPWLATVYVPGPSLAEAVARRGPLPVPAVLWLMAGVAEALQAIHGAGIVHRDLKPSNVLLAADGPRVIDFGISLASDITSNTATGSAIGTPQFMAPEQATAGEVTSATDVFALGQTAAFAALGGPLYGDGPAATVLYRIVHSEPDLSPLPEQIRPLIARCLAADPAERATLAEVVEWCRQRLGPDADAGAGPAVWREIAGAEATIPAPVPAPVPDPTPALDPTPVHTLPLIAPPQVTVAERPRTRRRRVALITVAAVTAGALLLAGLIWTAVEGADRLLHQDTATSSTPDTTASARSSASSSSSASAAGSESTSGTGGGAPETSSPSSTAATTPLPEAFSGVMLTKKNSVSIKEPPERDNRKGDIRFVCEYVGCSLESDTSVISLLYSKPGATLDSCRFALTGAKDHDLPLAAVAAGSEICVKDPSGNIALFVVQVKSTALWDTPGISFLTADMTVWRAA